MSNLLSTSRHTFPPPPPPAAHDEIVSSRPFSDRWISPSTTHHHHHHSKKNAIHCARALFIDKGNWKLSSLWPRNIFHTHTHTLYIYIHIYMCICVFRYVHIYKIQSMYAYYILYIYIYMFVYVGPLTSPLDIVLRNGFSATDFPAMSVFLESTIEFSWQPQQG